jgi:hypothetical protein
LQFGVCGVGATLGVCASVGVSEGVGTGAGVEAAGPPRTAASAADPPLRAIAVPATATPITAAAAIPPTTIRVIRRCRPGSFIVALRT